MYRIPFYALTPAGDVCFVPVSHSGTSAVPLALAVDEEEPLVTEVLYHRGVVVVRGQDPGAVGDVRGWVAGDSLMRK